MREDWPNVRMGSITTQLRRREAPQAERTYRFLGVRGKGMGPFLREELGGDVTKAVALTPVRQGQFIYNRLFAGSGSFGVVPRELDGGWVSNEFPVFDVDAETADVAFLGLIFQLPETWERVAVECTGTTGSRMRWHERQFAEFVINLPSLAHQRRIVNLIAAIDSAHERARLQSVAAVAVMNSIDAATSARLRSMPTIALAEIADVVGGVTKDAKRQVEANLVEVPYLRVANVQRGSLDLREIASIRVSAAKVEALRLKAGDILFNEGGDRDKLGRGWVWEGQLDPCIHQNHVLRARLRSRDFDPWFISTWGNGKFGQRWFEDNGAQTTNLASVSLSTLRTFPVPAIPIADQRQVVELHLAVRAVGRAAGRVQQATTRLRSAVLTDLLCGSREIPETYDRFFDGDA